MKKMKTKLNVSGMHCSSCEIMIKEAVESITGVKSAKASQEKGTVEIEYDEKKANLQTIKKAIKNEGYAPE